MFAEIIAVGTELTTGAKLDTNSQWLSIELAGLGIPVKFHTTVADDLEANVAVLRSAVERADLVIVTGGLGPTLDDLTRDVVARLVEQPLVLHEPSLLAITEMFARRGRPMPPRNVVQAMFPASAVVLPNPRGTAPGIFVEVPRSGQVPCRVACLPGVPSEMKAMFFAAVVPRIQPAECHRRQIASARLNVFGLGESACEELLGDITARGRDPEVGITVHEATITLRIVATGDSVVSVAEKITATSASIRERLGSSVFGIEDEELQDIVVRELRVRQETVATAEAGTAGLIAERLAVVPDAATVVLGGLVSSTLEGFDRFWQKQDAAKSGSLPETISAATTATLASRCREYLSATYAVATSPAVTRTGDGGDHVTGQNSAPLMYVAVAGPGKTVVQELNLAGDAAIVRSRAAKSALNALRLEFLS